MSSRGAKPFKVGVIDVGSNSIKLLIAQRGQNEPIEFVDFIAEEVRIGEGISGNPPNIDTGAIEAGSDAIKRLVEQAHEIGVDSIAVIATSAAREAVNKQAFVNAVERRCGHELRILSGDEEAAFIGRGILCDPQLAALQDFTHLDLGGGSLERVVFRNRSVVEAISLPLGAVRLANRFVSNRSATLPDAEREAIAQHLRTTLAENEILPDNRLTDQATLTGGSATLIAQRFSEAFDLGVHLDQLKSFASEICSHDCQGRIDTLGLPKARADIMPTASTILVETLDYLGLTRIRFSHYNLRYGIAQMLLDGKGV